MKKNKRIIWVTLSVIMLLLGSIISYASENTSTVSMYCVTRYNESNGVPTGEANTVCQTSDGYIWIGTYGGLLRYDGVSFEGIGIEKGMESYSIRSLKEDSEGRFWVGSNDKGAFIYDGKRFTAVDPNGTSYRSVRSMTEDSKGRMWLGTNSGIAYVEDEAVKPFDITKYGHDNSTVYSIAGFDGTRLWAVDSFGSIMEIDAVNDVLLGYYEPGELWDKELSAYTLICASSGKLYVGTSGNSLLCFDVSNGLSLSEIIDTETIKSVNTMCETKDGDIYLAATTGVGLYSDGEFFDCSYINESDNLSGMTEDYEHNLWFASSKYGVLKFEPARVGTLTGEAELDEKETFSVCMDGDIRYIGYESGILTLDKYFQKTDSILSDEYDGIHVHQIVKARDGKIYIGSFFDGLGIYDPEAGTVERKPINGNKCRTLLELSDGRVVVGTENGIDIFADGELAQYVDLGGMVLCLLEGEDGSIICGMDGTGIITVKDGAFETYADTKKGLSGGVILRMKKDAGDSGKIWVSCGNELFYGNNDGFKKMPAIAVGSGSILDIFPVGDKLWLFRTSAVLCYSREELFSGKETSYPDYYYDSGDGLPGPITANAFSILDGDVFNICTVNGMGILDTKESLINIEKPKVAINEIVLSDGSVWDGNGDKVLSKDITRISFDLAALTFTGDSAKVEYKLEGFDSDYQQKDPHEQSLIEYTNLGKGNYTFRLKAINSDGVEGDEISVSFVKEPKFTETIWFYVVIALAAAITVMIIAFARVHAIKLKEMMYKQLTDQTISTISGAIDAKDPYTQGHSKRVADFSVKIGKKLGLSEDQLEKLYYIALLHDIGKIGVPDDILKKPSRLTDEEFTIIKNHTKAGGEILKNLTILPGVSEGALYHHERYDGKGYVTGLKGKDIPFFARIISVADSYDAMNSSRCYRKALSKDIIMSEIEKGKGTQFDPDIADVALDILGSEKEESEAETK